MTTYLPMAVITTCHFLTCFGNVRQGDYPHALMWACYGTATIALMWYEYQK